MNCPSSHELSNAITAGAASTPGLDAHLASCPACTAEWRATVDTIALAREGAPPLPSPARRDEVRALLLNAGRVIPPITAPRRHVAFALGAIAAAAAIAIVLVARRDDTPAVHAHGTVRALPGASYLASSTTPDEIVLLYDGAIDVSVSPLHPGDRFRVLVGSDEIEVHGTEFIATARAGVLVDVRVVHGIVDVRPRHGAARLLRAGESWTAEPVRTADVQPVPPPAPIEPSAPVIPPRAKRVAQRTVAPAAKEPPTEIAAPPQERAYDEGWTAMRAAQFADAAKAFQHAHQLDPAGALAEDASYWHAVALARAKSPTAIAAFRGFLDHYPHAARTGEASTMLGWLLVDAKQHAEAERRFRAALSDPNRAVQESARAGLDAVAR